MTLKKEQDIKMQDDDISVKPLYLRLNEREKGKYHSNIAIRLVIDD